MGNSFAVSLQEGYNQNLGDFFLKSVSWGFTTMNLRRDLREIQPPQLGCNSAPEGPWPAPEGPW